MRHTPPYDAVVVGAGPYGLSTAAHLKGRGLKVAVFGKPLGLWRDHMPKRMLLRSLWWCTSLSDPRGEFRLERFCQETGNDKSYPLPLEVFVQYGLWFKERAVPEVDETLVTSITSLDGGGGGGRAAIFSSGSKTGGKSRPGRSSWRRGHAPTPIVWRCTTGCVPT
ncbi:MAG TPA: NAD(P)-binding protein [Gemmatimonadales bacterium]|nr:NAD(P)-binding protein [Gemmatimonadales bacterium]